MYATHCTHNRSDMVISPLALCCGWGWAFIWDGRCQSCVWFLDEIVIHIIVWKWTREMWDRMDDVEKESYYVFRMFRRKLIYLKGGEDTLTSHFQLKKLYWILFNGVLLLNSNLLQLNNLEFFYNHTNNFRVLSRKENNIFVLIW